MKPIKTVKKGKQSSLKRASAGSKGKKTTPANATRASRAKDGADNKKKTAAAAFAATDESSAKDRGSAKKRDAGSGTAGVKSRGAAISRKPSAGKLIASKKAGGKAVTAEKTLKAGSTGKKTEKLPGVISASPGSRLKRTTIRRRLPAERKASGPGEAAPVVSRPDSSARIFPKRAEGRLSRTKLQTVKAPSAKIPPKVSEILTPELPHGYGENEFFLIPVEPRVVYACWEIGEDSMPEKEGRLEVRFFEAAQGESGRLTGHPFLDISISDRVGDAFFKIAAHGREIIAEIGHLGADGHFMPILRSRKVLVPSSLEQDEPEAGGELPGKGVYGSRPPDKS